jgi:hypothetical protein
MSEMQHPDPAERGEVASPFAPEILPFDPAADFDAFCLSAPARWAVYLLADADGKPIQLLCVKNLRASLRRRLGGEETIGLTKRVNYREIVRSVRWQRVDSDFEADLVYFEAARALFPESYRGMVGLRPAWFVHMNPETRFPRYVKVWDIAGKSGIVIGPLADKHAAARLIELAQDAFDLCRYYNILIEAPNARACAYKEMGKCPAPCDGSISMEQYRRMMQWSAEVMVEPAEFQRDQTRRMQAAAGELQFEMAARIKAYVDEIAQFGAGPFRHVHLLENFRYLSLQRGPRPHTAKAFVITPGKVETAVCCIGESPDVKQLLRQALAMAIEPPRTEGAPPPLDMVGVERIGVVTNHLFLSKSGGAFLPLRSITEKATAKALRDLEKQKPIEETEGEGVEKQLQAMD